MIHRLSMAIMKQSNLVYSCHFHLADASIDLSQSLAIARIFGGFSEAFFRIYHEKLPKTEPADQYELRVDLYELFHYLNHTLIFGGVSRYVFYFFNIDPLITTKQNGYRSSALQKMDRLLRYCH